MNATQVLDPTTTAASTSAVVDMKLEVLILPVADVHASVAFYSGLGWRLDADIRTGDARVVHFTPPGSACSVLFGTGVSPAAPGSAQYNFLVVSDIIAAREDLNRRGVAASEVFHDRFGGYRFDPDARASGPDPERRTYASFVTFSDPDGNSWLIQEVTTRFPGRIDSTMTTFASARDLANALRRAEGAHGEHERRSGRPDADWPAWYAAYLVAEQSGEALPA